MKLVIGLGNPGEKFKNNRHNVGYMVVDKLKGQSAKLKNAKVSKTDCFMNDSGNFVKRLVQNSNLNLKNLYIVHDDLDIKLGDFKIQFGRGPKVHNGLNDIYDKLGSKDFWHVRVGVDNRTVENRTSGEEYVLQNFIDEEKAVLDNVINDICKKLVTL